MHTIGHKKTGRNSQSNSSPKCFIIPYNLSSTRSFSQKPYEQKIGCMCSKGYLFKAAIRSRSAAIFASASVCLARSFATTFSGAF